MESFLAFDSKDIVICGSFKKHAEFLVHSQFPNHQYRNDTFWDSYVFFCSFKEV